MIDGFGCRGIGNWLLKILAEFYKMDEDEEADVDEENPGESQRGALMTQSVVIEV